MRPKLRALATKQGGVFTRHQALAVGYSEREIRSFTRRQRHWVVVRRGVYCEREVYETLDPYDGRLQLADRAANVTMVHPHLMSHDSAARAWRLPMLKPEQQLVHVTRFGVGGSRTEGGVKHHLTRLGLLDTAILDGMKLTGVGRTALDLAREHGLETGIIACDAALRRTGTTLATMECDLELMWCWPGVTRARAALALADPGAETPGESLLRLLVVELVSGLELDLPVITQFPVRAGGRVFWTDLRVGRHVFEFDGFTKFARPALGNTGQRTPAEVAWEEKRRQDLICSEGLGMSRVVWSELLGSARHKTLTRIRGELLATIDRFGTDLPAHLARAAHDLVGARLARQQDQSAAPRCTHPS